MQFFIYMFLDVNWGSSTQAHSYKNALLAVQKLANTEEHVKNYRPQILVLTGNPAARPSLVDFVYNITRGSSLMICGYVIPVRSIILTLLSNLSNLSVPFLRTLPILVKFALLIRHIRQMPRIPW